MIHRIEYALTEESDEALLIEEENWEAHIRPGMDLFLNMVIPAAPEWTTNHCPKCNEATFGRLLPGKHVKWYFFRDEILVLSVTIKLT